MAATTIKFTGEQARGLAGVTPEAWRHWRSVVPYLQLKRGKGARFSIGEIVVLRLLAQAVSNFGIGVSRTAPGWNRLFELCADQRPADLRDAEVRLRADDAEIAFEGALIPAAGFALAMGCAPIVDTLMTAAFPDLDPSSQRPLPFAPRLVAGSTR